MDAEESVACNKPLIKKVCMITGASNGIGLVTARALAEMGAELYLVCRNQNKGESVVSDLKKSTKNDNITLLPCDLSSLSCVRRLAEQFLALNRPLHILLNNSGVFNFKRFLTEDNHEEMFAVNHLAHYLLTNLLLNCIIQSHTARIISVSSDAHWFCKSMNFDDLSHKKQFNALRVYAHSKLANSLFTQALPRRLEGSEITANALHPGGFGIRTGLGLQNGKLSRILSILLYPFLQSPEQGAKTSIYACTASELKGVSSAYLKHRQTIQAKPWALDYIASERLWEISAKLVTLPKST